MLKNKEEIITWLENNNIVNYIIHDDFSISVNESVFLRDKNLKQIPLQFNVIHGSFDCSNNQLTSLFGSPKIINGDCNFSRNKLKDLEYCPNIVRGNFLATYNNIHSLKFFPNSIGKGIYLQNNNLIFLENLPQKVCGHLLLVNNYLTSMEGLPKNIQGTLDISYNHISTLQNTQLIEVDSIVIHHNEIRELKEFGYFHSLVLKKLFIDANLINLDNQQHDSVYILEDEKLKSLFNTLHLENLLIQDLNKKNSSKIIKV